MTSGPVSTGLFSCCVIVSLLAGVSHGQTPHPVTTAGCGTTKGCLHYPATCQTPNCESLVTWNLTSDGQYVSFELMVSGPVTPNIGWGAIGFSLNTLMVGVEAATQRRVPRKSMKICRKRVDLFFLN